VVTEYRERGKISEQLLPMLADPWPAGCSPWTDGTLHLLKEALAQQGWCIALFFYGGPAPSASENYVEANRRALRDIGIELVEIWDIADYPGVHLMVGVKADHERAVEIVRNIVAAGPVITRIHGRAQVPNHARQIFGLVDGPEPKFVLFRGQFLERLREVATAGNWWERARKHARVLFDRYCHNANEQVNIIGNAIVEYAAAFRERGAAVVLIPEEGLNMPAQRERLDAHEPGSFLISGGPEAAGQLLPNAARLNHVVEFADDEAWRIEQVNAHPAAPWSVSKPFRDAHLAALARCLKRRGVLVIEARAGGFSVEGNQAFRDAVAKQLETHGLLLMELYYLVQLPGMFLLTAVKGTAEDAAHTLASATKGPAIGSFHARAEQPMKAELLWSLAAPNCAST
jgi:hypothetical protein